MSIKKSFLSELKQESGSTRKMLERVPIDKLSWKPHEKSQSLEQLAKHIAALPVMLFVSVTSNERDILATGLPPLPAIESTEQLLAIFNTNVEKAMHALENANDETMKDDWVLRAGDNIMVSTTRENAIRYMYFNHSVHHRGQLSVYLRLLDVPVPGMYGPTADEKF